MQTLKTAAIVVLLMTIIYGAYVSLTTPPEPLPPEVENMLVMSEEGDFSIDTGLPESLGGMSIDAGTEASADADLGLSLGNESVASEIDSGAAWNPDSAGISVDNGVTGSLSDDAVSLSGGVAPSAAAVARTDLQPSYPSTGQSFSMPNPREMDGTFRTVSSVAPSSESAAAEIAAGTPGEAASLPAIAGDTTAADATGEAGEQGNIGLTNAIRTADRQYQEDRLKEALATLSLFYNASGITSEQRQQLLSRLDPLAREVIYSQRHLLEQPYRVGQSETLVEVASRFEVPWQLLANINQVEDPVTVLPGTELKVVRGPFRGEVDLKRNELTLFLGDLYAGRFPITVGSDPAPKPGTFTVQDKQKARTYYDASGSPVPPGSPQNPYGNVWLDLGGQLCIHGSPSTTSATDKGCISLAGDYADDLYGILSQGSSVTIRR